MRGLYTFEIFIQRVLQNKVAKLCNPCENCIDSAMRGLKNSEVEISSVDSVDRRYLC